MTQPYVHLLPSEVIARVALEKGYFRRDDRTPHTKAFEPKFDLERQRFELSVFRIDGLANEQLWELADQVGANRAVPKAAMATCNLFCESVAAVGLDVEIDEPPVRHAVIVNWPEADELKLSKQQDLVALGALCVRADLSPVPTS